MSRDIEDGPAQLADPDPVDAIVAQWRRERPDVDVSGMEIIGRLSRLNQAIRPHLDRVFAANGLEAWEFDVLATLVRNGEPHQLTPGQLLDSMMVTSGAMTNRIDRLEGRGLVRRVKSTDDGRQVLVTLTAAGRQRLDAALVDHAANERAILEGLGPDDRDQLVILLRRLHHVVAAVSADGPG